MPFGRGHIITVVTNSFAEDRIKIASTFGRLWLLPVKISVALCTFNGATHLEQQLESLLKQTLLPTEVILSDDMSEDNTVQIAQKFADRTPFPVRILQNPTTLGSTKNFEQAMRACSGDYVALCDQDDIWYPQKLETLARALQNPAYGAAFSDGDVLQDDGSYSGTLWQSFGLVGSQVQAFKTDPVAVMVRGNKVTGMTLIVRRSLLELLLPIPAFWVHDYWLAWMLILYSCLAPCPERLVAYRSHTQQQLGVPIRFLPAVRQRGLGAVLIDLGQRAQRENSSLVPQLVALLARLQQHDMQPRIASAIPRIVRSLGFHQMRSRVQQRMFGERFTMICAHWRQYSEFSLRPWKDRLVDLVAPISWKKAG